MLTRALAIRTRSRGEHARVALTPGRLPRAGSRRAAFTLVELVISMTILSFSSMVIGGLMLAISSAWDHCTAVEDTRRQAQAAMSRIKWMIQQSGTYRVTGQSTMSGLAVDSTSWGQYQAPKVLVVWSGGSNGGMNALGLQTRLPLASELVMYTLDANSSARLVEITFPGDTTTVDFAAAKLTNTIASLLKSKTLQTIVLCDRLHVTNKSSSGNSKDIGDIRFELTATPTDDQISAVTVGSLEWNSLPWGQGLVGADRGLRTVNVRIELLLDPNPAQPATDNGYSTALPFLASVNRQYVYQP